MRLHKLLVAMSALAGGIASVNALALGLGDVKLHTALNQPLIAEIELMQVEDLSRSEILSNLASKSDFARAGVERPQVLNDLKFKTEVGPNGKGIIKITSKNPIQEPFLNFLVEVHWPSGRLLKEYTLLLDPPVFSGLPLSSVVLPNAPRAPSARPASRSGYLPPSGAVRPERNTLPGSLMLNSSSQAAGGQLPDYQVKRNDNLWNIAQQVRPDPGVTVQQTMLAIQRKNPQSFVDSNINRLKNGEILRIPDRVEITSLPVSDAIAVVSRQNREWQQWRSQVAQLDATRSQAPALSDQKTTVDDKLAIVSAEVATGSGQDTGGGIDQENAALQTELAMTREQLDKLSRENAELSSRLQDLDDQIVTLRRLVEMKDDQMAVLQQRLQQNNSLEEPAESQVTDIVSGLVDNKPLYLLLGLIPFAGVVWLLIHRRRKKREETEASERNYRPRPGAAKTEARTDASPKPVASPSAEVAAKFDQALAHTAEEVETKFEDTDTGQVLTELEALGDAKAIAQTAEPQSSFDDELVASIDEDDIPDLDLDGLELADNDFKSSINPETAGNAEPDVDFEDLDLQFDTENTLASDSEAAFSNQGVSSLEASLDEDFDFLSESDEVATKLDLARAYIDMGDRDGASAILQEVLEQGTDVQKKEAKILMDEGSG